VSIYNYLDKSKIFDREIDRLTYARDASIYRILPEFAVRPTDESDIQKLFEFACEADKSVTFRASGTSLSGQTVTDGIVAEIAYDWQNIEVNDDGSSIILEPGVIGNHANQALCKYQKRIGPDPASLRAARIGGIVANNASGMTTGKPCNSYHTLKNVRFILSNGNIYDTTKVEDYSKFEKQEMQLFDGLKEIRDKIKNDKKLFSRIKSKYLLKNTIGYSMNSFIDYDHPLDIFAHLLIGSEGTLGFVSNIELETVPDPPHKSTCLIFFDNIELACTAIENIKNTEVHGLELMDYACLKTAKYYDGLPFDIKNIKEGTAALLCEFQEFDASQFDELEEDLLIVCEAFNGKLIGEFARDADNRDKLWKIRKNLFTTVGSMRKPGTSIITEDLCFDTKDLGNVITELHTQFDKWGYEDAVVFGHAKDGNIHFNLSIDLGSESGIEDYHRMLEAIVKLTVEKYNGSLKAEHGTGRNMAPYVEYEWGSEIYKLMWKIKELADPQNILNRGVILNEDKNIHTKNLKTMPIVSEEIDLCVECGFCEPVCPSRGFTFTPRNRISVAREIVAKSQITKHLKSELSFNTELTCAVDGMCELECPIGINTGEYVKELRKAKHKSFNFAISRWIGGNFSFASKVAALMIMIIIKISNIFGRKFVENTFLKINKIFNYKIYAWNRLITGIKKSNIDIENQPDYIYYPSCISRTIGADEQGMSLEKIIYDISKVCNVNLITPSKITSTCCGTPFSSKGFEAVDVEIFEKTINYLYDESEQGKLPIVVDTSPCTYKFLNPSKNISDSVLRKWKQLKFIDIIGFLEKITANIDGKRQPLDREIVLHPTCSTHKMSDTDALEILARRCATSVTIPNNSSCCGFAGDRGLIVPGLSKNAAKLNKVGLNEKVHEGYSSSRMCEIGMSSDTLNYRNIAYLVRDFLMTK